jgi:hypothetical protein
MIYINNDFVLCHIIAHPSYRSNNKRLRLPIHSSWIWECLTSASRSIEVCSAWPSSQDDS